MNKLIIYKTLFLLIFVSSCSSGEDEVQNENSSDYTIWNGGKITFTKSDDSDPTNPDDPVIITVFT